MNVALTELFALTAGGFTLYPEELTGTQAMLLTSGAMLFATALFSSPILAPWERGQRLASALTGLIVAGCLLGGASMIGLAAAEPRASTPNAVKVSDWLEANGFTASLDDQEKISKRDSTKVTIFHGGVAVQAFWGDDEFLVPGLDMEDYVPLTFSENIPESERGEHWISELMLQNGDDNRD